MIFVRISDQYCPSVSCKTPVGINTFSLESHMITGSAISKAVFTALAIRFRPLDHRQRLQFVSTYQREF